MMLRPLSFLTVFVACFSLTACQTNIAKTTYPDIHVETTTPAYTLNVATIDVSEEYQSSLKAPNVEHIFPVSPAKALHSWVNDRLHAEGREQNMRVVVKNAGIVEKELPRTKGVKGVFTQDQSQEYTASLEVAFEIYGADPLFPADELKVSVKRSRSVPEDITLQERNDFYYQLVKDLMQDFNTEVERYAGQRFYKYIVQK